jgi:hypothetical protein
MLSGEHIFKGCSVYGSFQETEIRKINGPLSTLNETIPVNNETCSGKQGVC